MFAPVSPRKATTAAAVMVGLLLPVLYGAVRLAPEEPMDLALETGKITISGTSNAHDWSCDANGVLADFRVRTPGTATPPTTIDRAAVAVPVEDIRCGNGTMEGKLRDALKAEEFPTIAFTMSGYELVQDSANPNRFTVGANGTLRVAGVTKPLELEVRGTLEGDRLHLRGTRDLLMTDFGVKPPTAMLGVLKTGDKVAVTFDLATRYRAAGAN